MNARICLLAAVFSFASGDDVYPQPPVRYSIHVPQPPLEYSGNSVGFASHPVGYASHTVGYTGNPVGYASHPVSYTGHPMGYTTSVHQTPFTVYSVPGIQGHYLAPQLSVVHAPYLAAGHTVYSTPQATPYSVREPHVPPCRQLPSPTIPPPTTPPQTPSPQVATAKPPPLSGINAHYKIPNPLSLFNSFASPSVNSYHAPNSKDIPSSSQNHFSIGISTPKFDD